MLKRPADLSATHDAPTTVASMLIITGLFRFAEREFGQKRARDIASRVCAFTPLAKYLLTENGFIDPINDKPADTQQLFPTAKARDITYARIISQFIASLHDYFPSPVIDAKMQDLITVAKQQTGVLIKINQPQKHESEPSLLGRLRGKIFKGNKNTPSLHKELSQSDMFSLVTQLLQTFVDDAVMVVNQEKTIVFTTDAIVRLLEKERTELEGASIDDVIKIANDSGTIDSKVYLPIPIQSAQPFLFQGKDLLLVSAPKPDTHVTVETRLVGTTPSGMILYAIRISNGLDDLTSVIGHSDIISVTAHELKTPITSLRGYVALLQEELSAKLTQDQLLFFDRISSSTNQLLALLDNLLAFAKIESHTMVLHLESLNLQNIVEKIIDDIKPIASVKHITIHVEMPNTPLPAIIADPIRISEVISNLVTNAIKFNHSGGSIWIRLSIKGGMFHCEISDNGIGIPDHAVPKLFNKYYQVPTAKPSNSGAGLGLYIAKEIIEAHHGLIWVHAKEGFGSTFEFSLPLSFSETINPNRNLQNKHVNRMFHSGGIPLTGNQN